MTEVVTLGECMGVLYPEQPVTLDAATTLTLDIGGAEANLAIRLSRLGHTTRFISRVGDDPFGCRIRATLAACNDRGGHHCDAMKRHHEPHAASTLPHGRRAGGRFFMHG